METNIGTLIRNLRLDKRLTLKKISEKTGLSISFLSQVETSKSSITLQSLTKISEALDVSRSYFFPDQQPTASFFHKADESHLDFSSSKFIYQGLSGNISNPIFEPMLVIILPNDQRTNSSSHTGQEFIYVLEGTLTVVIGSEETDLGPGDSFHVDSSTLHTWYNQTTESVKLLFVYAPANNRL